MEEERVNKPSPSLRQSFAQACPYYMSIGMTFDEFWYKESWRTIVYRRADDIRFEKDDMARWLNGRYVYEAIGRLSPVLNWGSKTGKAEPYLDLPFTKQAKPEEQQKTQREYEEAEIANAKILMSNLRRQFKNRPKLE